MIIIIIIIISVGTKLRALSKCGAIKRLAFLLYKGGQIDTFLHFHNRFTGTEVSTNMWVAYNLGQNLQEHSYI
jgi:hypothetical protein